MDSLYKRSAVTSYGTEGEVLLLHLFPPQRQQQAAVLLVKGAGVGQEACGQKDVPHQVFDLSLKPRAAVGPTDLRHNKTRCEMKERWTNEPLDGWKVEADLFSSQAVDQSACVGHLPAAGLGVILQVLLLLHGSVVKRLKVQIRHIHQTLNIIID